MTKPAFDLRLYLVVGRGDCAGRPLVEVVEAAVAGGVTLVQLREKQLHSAELAALARELLAVLRPLGIPLIVNDDLEAALASDADGLHVGQQDLDAGEARRKLGPDRILGLSISTDAEAHAVDPRIVDYLGIGPVHATPTKTDAGPALGPAGTARLRRRWPAIPACAIGGIKAENAAEVMATGVDGLAVVSAIAGAPDPRAAAEDLRNAMLRARPG
ncbi:MAG TPA: thiamine phosphate synthase [Kiloniellales bacterium]|nr:thiamine phosphate synthase [Kiloniellales bacterium]